MRRYVCRSNAGRIGAGFNRRAHFRRVAMLHGTNQLLFKIGLAGHGFLPSAGQFTRSTKHLYTGSTYSLIGCIVTGKYIHF